MASRAIPSISKISFRTIKDGNTRTAELMTGAIDWIWDVPKDQAERMAANPAIKVENAKTLRISYLQFDVNGVSGQKFFTDKRVRQAVAHAIDRVALTKNLVGSGVRCRSTRPVTPTSSDARATLPNIRYDPAKAKALLKEAGFPDGFEFDLYAYRDREYTEAVIGDLAKVGLRAKLNYVQYHGLHGERAQGPHPRRARHLGLQLGSRRRPRAPASFFLHGPDDLAKDAEVKQLIDEADGITDPDKRKAVWQKALRAHRRGSRTGCRSSPTPNTTPTRRTSISPRPPTRSRSSTRPSGNSVDQPGSDPSPRAPSMLKRSLWSRGV